MKIFRLVFLFHLILSKNLAGQSYIHFPDTSAIWQETYVYAPPPAIWNLWYDHIGEIHYGGDTIINNLYYHKLIFTQRNIFCSRIIESVEYAGALREDTIERKVYYRNPLEDQERLIYDFNLRIGDIIPGPTGVKVVSIDTIITNDGIRRTRWNASSEYYPGAIIEGIGSTNGILSNTIGAEYPSVTICFEGDSKQSVYINDVFGYQYGYCQVLTDTCYYLANSSGIESKIEIYPNPIKVDSYINILIPESEIKNLESLKILDIYGNVIFSDKSGMLKHIKSPKNAGCYLFILQFSNNRTNSYKLMITN